ncbi:MAG: nucleotidyltransferase family protein [Trueperaceae bacterium]
MERFLTDTPDTAPDPQLLSELGLASYAAGVLSNPGPVVRTAEMVASARHLAVRGELRRLLRSWQRSGIEALVFKGFHLAEFVYPATAQRRYSDVDLLIRPSDAVRAGDLAQEQCWQLLWHADWPATAHARRTESYSGHEVMQLRHRRSGVHLDVHRRLVHNNHNHLASHGRQERITRQAWAKSQVIDWDGVRVRQLHPVDAVLIGLVLNRSWSPEDWELRAHDYLDFRILKEEFELEPWELEDRAIELGCANTYRIFRSRCDPFEGVCNLTAPSRLQRHLWNLLVAPERGNRYLERSMLALAEILIAPFAVLRELPAVLEALRLAQLRESLRSPASSLAMPRRAPRRLTAGRWRRIRMSIHRCLRILGRAGYEDRELQAIALLLGLRRRSYQADLSWVAGPDGNEHPRLELDGVPLSVEGTLLADRTRSD